MERFECVIREGVRERFRSARWHRGEAAALDDDLSLERSPAPDPIFAEGPLLTHTST